MRTNAQAPTPNRPMTLAERVRQKAQERTNRNTGSWTLAIPEGVEQFTPRVTSKAKNIPPEMLNIIPYKVKAANHPQAEVGMLWYERTYLMHRNIGPENRSYVCPKSVGLPCPICEEYNRAKKDPDIDEKTAKALKPSERQLFNVEDVAHPEKGIQLWDFSYHNFGKQLEAEINQGDETNSTFCDLQGGMTIRARFHDKKMPDYSYTEVEKIDFVERSQDYDKSVLDQVLDLDSLLKVPSYEELQKAFLGGAPVAPQTEQAAAEEVDAPRAPSRVPVRKVTSPAQPPVEQPVEENEEDQVPVEESETPGMEPEAEEGAADMQPCKACGQTGVSSKGGECFPCKGSGWVVPKAAPAPVAKAKPAPVAKPQPKPSPVRKPAPVVEDAPEVGEFEVEEEAETPTPAPSRRTAPAAKPAPAAAPARKAPPAAKPAPVKPGQGKTDWDDWDNN